MTTVSFRSQAEVVIVDPLYENCLKLGALAT